MQADDSLIARIDLMPLGGALLALVAILILVVPLQHEHAVTTGSSGDWGPPQSAVTITVAFDGRTYWNGEAVSDAELDHRLTRAAHLAVPPPVHIGGDHLARYGAVARILTAAKQRGLTRVSLDGLERF